MKFEDFPYERPDMELFESKFNNLLQQFKDAPTLDHQQQTFDQINTLRTDFLSMYNLCLIRHTTNTTDVFYEGENAFFDQNTPRYEALNSKFYQVLLSSRFRKELEEKWGPQLFTIAALSVKTFHPSILENLQKENILASEYVKLKAAAEVEFQGKTYNLSSIYPLEVADDRAVRRDATRAKWLFYEKNATTFDEIFDDLVKTRTNIARQLGFDDFIALGYARLNRSDYDAKKVSEFRDSIRRYLVPLASKLFERQRQRLQLDTLKHYDESYRFTTGNPKPKGAPAWIIEQASKMYAEVSEETKAFFQFMQNKNLMDLEAKQGKATGGYCTYIGKFKAPYIFSNFNGTSGDIDVLTHEAGHAFQVYSSRDFTINEYNWPTYEACEIHSMSMEFFTWPWMDLFFKEETNKYKFAHVANAVCFLPYGIAVDEFQHYVYKNPDIKPEERHAAWRAIEKKYLPHRDYDGFEFLESGRYWQRQNHIYNSPFYYIDYTLAQICAFQFWKKDRDMHDIAWKDYLRLCQAGGSKPFLELVKLANLDSPFDEHCVKDVVQDIEAWIDQIDDTFF